LCSDSFAKVIYYVIGNVNVMGLRSGLMWHVTISIIHVVKGDIRQKRRDSVTMHVRLFALMVSTNRKVVG
jgi:hypothetical protein